MPGNEPLTVLDALPMGDGQPYARLRAVATPPGVTRAGLNRDVMRIAGPAFAELMLTQLTGMADTIMVGRLPGELGVQALTAVGLCGQPVFLLLTLIQSLNIGATAVIARFRGLGSRERANQVFRTALTLNLALSLAFMLAGLLLAPQLIRLLSGSAISAVSFAYAVDYFRIQMIGFVPLCLTSTVTAALRGVGDSRTPLIYNTLANIVNVLLNALLIYGLCGLPALHVRGAAIATVAGRCAAFLIAFFYLFRQSRYIYLRVQDALRFDRALFRDIVRIGFPAMVEQVFMRLGAILYTRTVASLGDIPYATHQVCNNIQSIAYLTGQAFANASTTLTGQSLGRRRVDMAHLYSRAACCLGVLTAAVIAAVLALFGRPIVGLYNATPQVMDTGMLLLRILAYILPLEAIQFIYTGSLRGAGDTRYPAIVTFITVFLIRSGLAMLFIHVLHMSVEGAWLAFAIDQTVRTTLISLHYFRGTWQSIRLNTP